MASRATPHPCSAPQGPGTPPVPGPIKPVPRSKKDIKALIDQCVRGWESNPDKEYSDHPLSSRDRRLRFRQRALDLVKHCLGKPVKY